MFLEPAKLVVRRTTGPNRDLPAWADGLRIVHLTDTHYGPCVSFSLRVPASLRRSEERSARAPPGAEPRQILRTAVPLPERPLRVLSVHHLPPRAQ